MPPPTPERGLGFACGEWVVMCGLRPDFRGFCGAVAMAPRRTSEQQKSSRIMLRFAGMGTELTAGVAGFTLIGHLIDRWAGTQQTWLLTFGILGLVGGFTNFLRQAYRVQRELDELDQARRSNDDQSPKA